jgi:NADPH-dependent ferric siderophore reductase
MPIPVLFARERVRHPFAIRVARVAKAAPLAEPMIRVTLAGPELAGFAAPGPADHVRLFFPDQAGHLAVPKVTAAGVEPPERGRPISRDYTPLDYRPSGPGGPELDVDFVSHSDPGPASAWAAAAAPGDQLAVGGPRGSLLAPSGIGSAVVLADESALPAARRWLQALVRVPVTAVLVVADRRVEGYLADLAGPDRVFRWLTGPDRYSQAERELGALAIKDDTFVFLAGEAGGIVPLRRYLRRGLGLPKEQVDAHGYWKLGVAGLDHHAPLDPADPD